MKTYPEIPTRIVEFVEKQRVFFVATAPTEGHLNLSPRGESGTFAVLDEHTFAWLDRSGSGAETVAHLRENGRIVIMFCAFEGKPNIVRFHGTGRVVTRYDDDYSGLAERFVSSPSDRAVIVVDVTRVSDSCGHGVPVMTYTGDRDLIEKWSEKKGVEGAAAYRYKNNRTSIDGLRGFDDDPEP